MTMRILTTLRTRKAVMLTGQKETDRRHRNASRMWSCRGRTLTGAMSSGSLLAVGRAFSHAQTTAPCRRVFVHARMLAREQEEEEGKECGGKGRERKERVRGRRDGKGRSSPGLGEIYPTTQQ